MKVYLLILMIGILLSAIRMTTGSPGDRVKSLLH